MSSQERGDDILRYYITEYSRSRTLIPTMLTTSKVMHPPQSVSHSKFFLVASGLPSQSCFALYFTSMSSFPNSVWERDCQKCLSKTYLPRSNSITFVLVPKLRLGTRLSKETPFRNSDYGTPDAVTCNCHQRILAPAESPPCLKT